MGDDVTLDTCNHLHNRDLHAMSHIIAWAGIVLCGVALVFIFILTKATSKHSYLQTMWIGEYRTVNLYVVFVFSLISVHNRLNLRRLIARLNFVQTISPVNWSMSSLSKSVDHVSVLIFQFKLNDSIKKR